MAGATLTVPDVTSAANDAHTFKPFNTSEAVGSTSPALPYIQPPSSHGCGSLATIIMVAVAVVVTVYTAGAAGAALGSVASTASGATAATAAGVGTATACRGTTLTKG